MNLTEENEKIYRACPELYKNLSNEEYQGGFNINGRYLTVFIHVPLLPNLNSIKIRIFEGYKEHKINLEHSKYSDFYDFIKNIQTILKTQIISSTSTEQNNITNKSGGFEIIEIMKQIKEIEEPEDYNIELKKENNSIDYQIILTNFCGFDSNHYIKLSIQPNLNVSVTDCSIPVDPRFWEHLNLTKNSKIKNAVNLFVSSVRDLEDFYNNMNTIDTLCFVVEPFEITTKCNSRTIKYDDRVHIKFTVNPFNPSSIMIKLIGPTNDIEKLRNLYNDRIKDWDISLDIYNNLLRIFDLMYFPMKPDNFNNDDFEDTPCNICYIYRYENQLPLILCDNIKCNCRYHSVCLKEWFATLKDTKTFLDVTFGSCPFCKEKISTSYIDLYN